MAARNDDLTLRQELRLRKLTAETETAELQRDKEEILLKKHMLEQALLEARDWHNGTYYFFHSFNTEKVEKRMREMSEFVRYAPGSPLTLVINSPGGSVLDGFALYDFLVRIQAEYEVEVTTVASGMVASMGGVLFQAGTHRVMDSNAQLLIHKVSDLMYGDLDSLEDAVEFTKKLNERVLDILASKSKITRKAINTGWDRRDWWLDADEALTKGFCDEIV
jgi:ATP-dependent Clp protease protease subunit